MHKECNDVCASALSKSGDAPHLVRARYSLPVRWSLLRTDLIWTTPTAHGGEGLVPTMPGQEAFGTIQEIVRMLEADPATDWSKVNIGALREHLIDMDEVTTARTGERARPRQWRRDRCYRRGPHTRRDQAHGPGARARAGSARMECQGGGLAERRQACGDRGRSAPGRQDQGARDSWASWCKARTTRRIT